MLSDFRCYKDKLKFFSVQGVEHKASHMPDKHSTTELDSQAS